jgi:hypothetical protein
VGSFVEVFQVQAEGIKNKGSELFERLYQVSIIETYKVRTIL